MSSLEARPERYDPEDWQLLKASNNYILSKYQIDLIGTQLSVSSSGNDQSISHIVVHPGVVATNIMPGFEDRMSSLGKLAMFYLVRHGGFCPYTLTWTALQARWLGSPHHVIDCEKGAFSAVHASLVPISHITLCKSAFATSLPSLQSRNVGTTPKQPRFGAEVNFWGKVRLGMTEVQEWASFEPEARRLLEQFDALYIELSKKWLDE
jgi:3-keto steroid reductase